MTDNQLQYADNAKRSRDLVQYMERLIELADFEEKMLNVHSREVTLHKISEIKHELEGIWTLQVDLFFIIRDEYKQMQRRVFAESIRPPVGKALTKRSSAKDY